MNCAQWILRTGQCCLCLWTITTTLAGVAGHVILRFPCLDSVSLVFFKTPIILTPLKMAGNRKTARIKLTLFYFFVKQMSVVHLLHLWVPPWNNRCKTRSHPNFTLFLSTNQSVLALFPNNLLIRVVELNLILLKTSYTYYCCTVRPCLP